MTKTIGGMRATLFTAAAAFGSFLVGLLILAGGEARFSGIGFSAARDLTPWWAWGGLMLLSGLVALVGAAGHIPWASRIGHATACLTYVFLVVSLITVAAGSPTASLSGVGVYTAFALIHALAAASADEGARMRPARRAQP
jgi:hypothetical protein